MDDFKFIQIPQGATITTLHSKHERWSKFLWHIINLVVRKFIGLDILPATNGIVKLKTENVGWYLSNQTVIYCAKRDDNCSFMTIEFANILLHRDSTIEVAR